MAVQRSRPPRTQLLGGFKLSEKDWSKLHHYIVIPRPGWKYKMLESTTFASGIVVTTCLFLNKKTHFQGEKVTGLWLGGGGTLKSHETWLMQNSPKMPQLHAVQLWRLRKEWWPGRSIFKCFPGPRKKPGAVPKYRTLSCLELHNLMVVWFHSQLQYDILSTSPTSSPARTNLKKNSD